jgi:hypothetical protein
MAALAAIVPLSGCSPNAVPTGYVYHADSYKSANPPASPKFTALQRTTMGPEQAEQFRLAVYQLVDALTARAGMPPKPVHVMKPEPMTPFYANIDNDLRESLRHVGYRMSDVPEGAYIVTYKAENLVPDPAMANAPNMRITIHIHDQLGEEGRLLTQETGDFYIKGGEALNVPFASFPGTLIPEPTGPGGNFRE